VSATQPNRNIIPPSMTMIEALQDKNLLGQFLDDPETWQSWFCFLRAFFGLDPADGDLSTYRECTGRTEWPKDPAQEMWVVAGRRSGKSFITALLATYLSAFKEYKLASGETGHCLLISPTRQQSKVIKKYISSFFNDNAFLSPLMQNETAGEIELTNRVTITILSADFRSLRGYTAVAAILDECSFFLAEGSRPDSEVVRALRPALATTKGPLIGISSPYSLGRGVLADNYKRHFGQEQDRVLVLQAPSILLNPTLDKSAIDRALAEDPDGGAAEWLGQFRKDIQNLFTEEAVRDCVIPDRHELPPVPGVSYQAFCDPSGGSNDSMTLAIAHSEEDVRVLDALRERKAPFSPDSVVEEFSEALRSYGCHTVVGDRYGGIWPAERFQAHGIHYRPAEQPKSSLYQAMLPLINSARCELLDSERLIAQLLGLERRTSRTGKDSIDHMPGHMDDVANAAAGALVQAWSNSVFRDCDLT
jgi:hypothetical protein